MSDVIQGDLSDERPVEDVPRFLPPEVSRPLAASIAELLLFARSRGLDSDAMADRVVVFIAPLLVDKDVQVEQAGAALQAVAAHVVRQGDEVRRLTEIADRRAMQMHRLRAELWPALAEVDRYGQLTPQWCPLGLHDGWFAPSAGKRHPCPWCLINTLRGAEDVAALCPEHGTHPCANCEKCTVDGAS